MNLLIVDDYPNNRKLLRAALEAEGHRVAEASDGVEALEVLGREGVDAVISDILMPRMDGFRLCHKIRTGEKLNGFWRDVVQRVLDKLPGEHDMRAITIP